MKMDDLERERFNPEWFRLQTKDHIAEQNRLENQFLAWRVMDNERERNRNRKENRAKTKRKKT